MCAVALGFGSRQNGPLPPEAHNLTQVWQLEQSQLDDVIPLKRSLSVVLALPVSQGIHTVNL